MYSWYTLFKASRGEFTLELEIIGEGFTAKVYRDGDKAVKLYTNWKHEWVEDEAARQMFAYNAGLPVPKVFGVRQIPEGIAMDMELIAGQPLFGANMDKDERLKVLETMVKLQCAVHKINAEGQHGQADMLEWKINRATGLDESTKNKLIDRLHTLSTGKTSLCHGDFHPLNILRSDDKLWIIDWVDAVSGDPLADACRTYLIIMQYMTRMKGIYLRLFCKESGARSEDILMWLPIVAAARLSENATEKQDLLLNLAKEI